MWCSLTSHSGRQGTWRKTLSITQTHRYTWRCRAICSMKTGFYSSASVHGKKLTWPGAITNSACDHPLPGESLHAAARRVVRRELGCDIDNIITVLPHFRYRAVSAANIVEWEYCPVIAATVDSAAIRPNPDEVEGGMWLSWPSFVELTTQRDALGLSPWCKFANRAAASRSSAIRNCRPHARTTQLSALKPDQPLLPSVLAAATGPYSERKSFDDSNNPDTRRLDRRRCT